MVVVARVLIERLDDLALEHDGGALGSCIITSGSSVGSLRGQA
jgi:hypothetical protein